MKVGIDLVQVKRFEKMQNINGFLKKYFTSDEIEYCHKKPKPFETIAGIFATKEAFLKCFGIGISNFLIKDVEIKYEKNGKPFIYISDKIAQLMKTFDCNEIEISISHTSTDAIAICICK